MKPDLTDEETEALVRLLRDAIDADHYPRSPRVQMWKGIFAKIRPEAKAEPLPPLKHYERREPVVIGGGEIPIPAPPMTPGTLRLPMCA